MTVVPKAIGTFLAGSRRFQGQALELREQRIVSSIPALVAGASACVELPLQPVYGFLIRVALGARTEAVWNVQISHVGRGTRQALGCTEFWTHEDPGRPFFAALELDPPWEMDSGEGPFSLECTSLQDCPVGLVMWTFLQVAPLVRA